MHPKPPQTPSGPLQPAPKAATQDGPSPTRQARARTVVVRRGTLEPGETLLVPEGCSPLHVGMEHLARTQSPDLVDEWFVIEE